MAQVRLVREGTVLGHKWSDYDLGVLSKELGKLLHNSIVAFEDFSELILRLANPLGFLSLVNNRDCTDTAAELVHQ